MLVKHLSNINQILKSETLFFPKDDFPFKCVQLFGGLRVTLRPYASYSYLHDLISLNSETPLESAS
jgi:hypothetical protein